MNEEKKINNGPKYEIFLITINCNNDGNLKQKFYII
jgi:hypothetical protein